MLRPHRSRTHPGNAMAPRSNLNPHAEPAPPPGQPPLAGPAWPRAAVLAVCLCPLFPAAWDDSALPLWSPCVGVGLALIAWFGRNFGLSTLAASAALVVLRQL